MDKPKINSPSISEELIELYNAIFQALGTDTVLDWASQCEAAYLLPIVNDKDKEDHNWLIDQLRPVLHAYSIEFGIKKLIDDLPGKDTIRRIAESWLTNIELANLHEYVGAPRYTSDKVLQSKSGVSENLDSLYDAICNALDINILWSWASQCEMSDLLPILSDEHKTNKVWQIEQMRPVLCAYSNQFGAKKFLDDLPGKDTIRLIAIWWLTAEERKGLDSPNYTSDELLQFKPITSEIFQVENFGIEILQASATHLERLAIQYERNPQKQLTPSDMRNLTLDISTTVEALLTLMLVYYQEIFIRHNREFDEAFSSIKHNMPLSGCITAINSINKIFRLGETRSAKKDRKTNMENSKFKIEAEFTEFERGSLSEQKLLLTEKSELDEKCIFLLKEITRNPTESEAYEQSLSDIEERGKPDIDDRIKEIEQEINQAREEKIAGITQIQNDYEDNNQKRTKFASELQQACKRLFDRKYPFDGFNGQQITGFADRFRNPYAHLSQTDIERLIEKNGIDEIKLLAQEMNKIVSQFIEGGLFPYTFVVLGKVLDVSGWPVLMLCQLTHDAQNKPFWSDDNIRYVYRLKNSEEVNRIKEGDAFFMVPYNNEMTLFEPAMIECTKLVEEKLRPLLLNPKILEVLNSADN